ncbi:Hypothetical predicted protein [Podarcis lilfordi]|uniref:Uncharacterized protein n=1 Tax=Podarcis lilfordi TaxID=74358 RepID=A0AA35QQE5_9SAUR|nr:Hypothetical predicted protein [Podarcis lilfordi]
MVSNGCKCYPEKFGGRKRSLFITAQEITPRPLNRQKKIFEKSQTPGSQFQKKSDFRQFTQKWCPTVGNAPLKSLAVETEAFFSQDKKSDLDYLTGRRRFFEKSLNPRVTISEKSDFRQFTQKWCPTVGNAPLKSLAVEREVFLSQDKKSALDNLTGSRRFF